MRALLSETLVHTSVVCVASATWNEHASPPTYSGRGGYGSGLIIASLFGSTLKQAFYCSFLCLRRIFAKSTSYNGNNRKFDFYKQYKIRDNEYLNDFFST